MKRQIVTAVWVILAVALASTTGQASAAEELRKTSSQRIGKAVRTAANGGERNVEQAIAIIDDLLKRKSLPDYDRSVAWEIRGRLHYTEFRDPSVLADNLLEALKYATPRTRRTSNLIELTGDALRQAGRTDDALKLAVTYRDSFPGGAEGANLFRAEILAATGKPAEALALIGRQSKADDQPFELRLRYALVLLEGDYAAARQTLDTFALSPYYAQAVVEERRIVDDLERRGAGRQERLETGVEFSTLVEELFADVEPIERTPPSGFERCLSPGQKGDVHVRVRYDVDPQGNVSNVEIIESDNPCFNAASIEAVEEWKFRPATSNSRNIVREDLETTIVFAVS